MEQTNKPTNKPTRKQANKQTNERQMKGFTTNGYLHGDMTVVACVVLRSDWTFV
jgi:hypothetical protein